MYLVVNLIVSLINNSIHLYNLAVMHKSCCRLCFTRKCAYLHAFNWRVSTPSKESQGKRR